MSTDEDEQRAKVISVIGDLMTKTYDKASSYTNVILVAGYASAFTLWSFTKSSLTERTTLTVALLLLVSIATFIMFEIYKMITNSLAFKGHLKILNDSLSNAEFKAALAAVTKREVGMTKAMIPVWIGTLVVCVSTAIGAGGLLVYNFAAGLTGLPRWP